MDSLPPDYFTTSSAYTPHVFRDQYPEIDPTSSILSQAGKVIIITGANSGIGAQGLAPAFAKAGAKAIVLVARNQSRLDAVAHDLEINYSNVTFVKFAGSVTNEDDIQTLYQMVKDKFGHADVLLNNAGGWDGGAMLVDADPTKWWSDMEVNLKGPLLMSQGFLKLLGKENQGTIVTMNSGVAGMVGPTMSSYSISKNSSLRLMEYIAAEHPNINAVSLQPGVVMTDMVLDSFKRFALDTPELVGGTAVWLSTDAARFLTGRFISANWSVKDLIKQKDKIVAGNDLKIVYQGTFGLDQFDGNDKLGD